MRASSKTLSESTIFTDQLMATVSDDIARLREQLTTLEAETQLRRDLDIRYDVSPFCIAII